MLMRPLQIFTTGKSIEIDRRSWAQGLFEVSALSVVVNKALGQYFSLLASEKASAQSCYAE